MFQDTDQRRTFLVAMIYGLWSIIAAAVAVPAGLYLLLLPKRPKEEWAEAGDVANLTPGNPVEMVFRRNRADGWQVLSEKATAWVVKTGDGKTVAFAPQCTHLGCAYHWEEKSREFLCPCHTSVFDIEGRVLAGPAARPLDRYDIKVENNKLFVGRVHESTGDGV